MFRSSLMSELPVIVLALASVVTAANGGRDPIMEAGVGVVVAVLILRTVFDYLKERKRNGADPRLDEYSKRIRELEQTVARMEGKLAAQDQSAQSRAGQG